MGVELDTDAVQRKVSRNMAMIQRCAETISKELVGRHVRIKADSLFNDQLYGTSKKRHRGRVAEIMSVYCEPYDTPSLLLKGRYTCIGLDEVELL